MYYHLVTHTAFIFFFFLPFCCLSEKKQDHLSVISHILDFADYTSVVPPANKLIVISKSLVRFAFFLLLLQEYFKGDAVLFDVPPEVML